MKIMLVDDSKTMREIQRSVLSQMGLTDVVEACDGKEAWERVASIKPDLILLELNVPEMDGLAFVEAFRKTNRTTPVIMVTNEKAKDRVLEAIRSGVNNYVMKPFSPEILTRRIRETLAKFGVAA
jgi:two-component system chemotaxis response regulator CheY